MLDRADDFLDVVVGPPQSHLTLRGIIRRPGGALVSAPWQPNATDIDHGLPAGLEGIGSRLRPRDRVFPALGPDFGNVSMSHEAKRGRLGGEVGFKRPRRQEVIEDRVRVQGSVRQLDAFMLTGRPPLPDLLAIGMRQLLPGPFERAPGRVIEPLLIQRTDDASLMITL